jgi:hypothetical protein
MPTSARQRPEHGNSRNTKLLLRIRWPEAPAILNAIRPGGTVAARSISQFVRSAQIAGFCLKLLPNTLNDVAVAAKITRYQCCVLGMHRKSLVARLTGTHFLFSTWFLCHGHLLWLVLKT